MGNKKRFVESGSIPEEIYFIRAPWNQEWAQFNSDLTAITYTAVAFSIEEAEAIRDKLEDTFSGKGSLDIVRVKGGSR